MNRTQTEMVKFEKKLNTLIDSCRSTYLPYPSISGILMMAAIDINTEANGMPVNEDQLSESLLMGEIRL